MKNLTKIILIAMIAIMGSCSKEGPTGPAGTNGTNGNANVLYSDWITVTSADWSGLGTSVLTKDVVQAQLTADIIDKGIVLAYYQYGGITYPLPYASSTGKDHSDFTLTVGHITFKYFNPDGTNIPAIADVKYRYILVTATTHLRVKKPLSQMTYEEICNLFHIPM